MGYCCVSFSALLTDGRNRMEWKEEDARQAWVEKDGRHEEVGQLVWGSQEPPSFCMASAHHKRKWRGSFVLWKMPCLTLSSSIPLLSLFCKRCTTTTISLFFSLSKNFQLISSSKGSRAPFQPVNHHPSWIGWMQCFCFSHQGGSHPEASPL